MTGKRAATAKAIDKDRRIRESALTLFHERGYHAASVRSVAARARIDPAGLYYYYPSKQALLVSLLEGIMRTLIDLIEQAVAAAGPRPPERLRQAVIANVTFHGLHPREASISDSELRGVTWRNRARIVALRDRHEQIFRAIVERGNAEGCWHTDPRLAVFAIMAVCNEVCHWFRPNGPLPLEQIAAFDADFLIGALRAGTLAAPAASAGRRRVRIVQ